MSFKEGKKRSMSTPSADLLVCFPSRVPHHLTLMPSKPICSPARGGGDQPRHRRRRSITGAGRGRMKTKQMMSSVDVSEPTSPKVTCSGQIKVKHKKSSGGKGSWQSVMEEIERIHKQGKLKQRRKKSSSSPGTQSIGFLACLRNIKLDLRCFGVFPQPGMINSDDDEAEQEDDEEEEDGIDDDDDQEGRTVFSKWFMVLQEEKEELENNCTTSTTTSNCDPVIPPANALLLMRCRSAPPTKSLKTLMEEEKKTDNNNRLVVMSYGDEDADFYKISSDVAKETWVVGGIRDTLPRSRSWKR